MARCWLMSCSWLFSCLTDRPPHWQAVCLTEWLADHPTGERADLLLTDRLTDWYADLTGRLNGRRHAADWQMSLQSVGGQRGKLGGACWCVGRWLMQSCSCCWRQQERRRRRRRRWKARVRERESTMFSCDAKTPPEFVCVCLQPRHPGQSDSYNNLWLPAWHCES